MNPKINKTSVPIAKGLIRVLNPNFKKNKIAHLQ
jgi:hypothetical protein